MERQEWSEEKLQHYNDYYIYIFTSVCKGSFAGVYCAKCTVTVCLEMRIHTNKTKILICKNAIYILAKVQHKNEVLEIHRLWWYSLIFL